MIGWLKKKQKPSNLRKCTVNFVLDKQNQKNIIKGNPKNVLDTHQLVRSNLSQLHKTFRIRVLEPCTALNPLRIPLEKLYWWIRFSVREWRRQWIPQTRIRIYNTRLKWLQIVISSIFFLKCLLKSLDVSIGSVCNSTSSGIRGTSRNEVSNLISAISSQYVTLNNVKQFLKASTKIPIYLL